MNGGGPGFGADFGTTFADIFEGIFGMGSARGGRGHARERGSDLRYNMQILLEEAFHGKTAQIRIPTSVTCDACSGSGANAGTAPKSCQTCGGAGKIRHVQGFFTLERTCPACHGRGQVIDNPCKACGGAGRMTRERTLSVNIPAGVEDGTRIRLAGEGEAGLRGGPPGDLYIFLSLAQHEFFQREGADLYCRVPISMVMAALGGDFEVPVIDGTKTRVKVPPGTQTGRRFRLSGKGMPVLRSKQAGDMYVQVAVETPQNLSKRQHELLAEFEKLSSENTQPESAGFLGRVREFLDGLGNRGSDHTA
jgi:molecular chaperone DnaJ